MELIAILHARCQVCPNERDSCLEKIAEVLASITVPGCPCLKFRCCIIFRLFNNSVLYHLFIL